MTTLGERMIETVDRLEEVIRGRRFTRATWWLEDEGETVDPMAILRDHLDTRNGRDEWLDLLAFILMAAAATGHVIEPIAAVNDWYVTDFAKGGELSIPILKGRLRHEIEATSIVEEPKARKIAALLTLIATLDRDLH